MKTLLLLSSFISIYFISMSEYIYNFIRREIAFVDAERFFDVTGGQIRRIDIDATMIALGDESEELIANLYLTAQPTNRQV